MKYLHLLLLSLLSLMMLPSCSGSKDEPINAVFAFSSSDKNVSITGGGTHAVVNVGASNEEVTIDLLGTFVHADVECASSWIKAAVNDKVLTLTIDRNYTDNARSANITIKANDRAEIVLAYLVVNQSIATTDDLDAWQKAELLDIAETEGGIYEIPRQGELEKNRWYRVGSDNSVFFRLVIREENTELIKSGDTVYPTLAICHIYDM